MTTEWHSALFRHISDACVLMGSHLAHGHGLGISLKGSEGAGRHTALTLKVRSSVHAWSSHIFKTRQFLFDRGLQTQFLLMLSFLKGRWLSQHSVLRVTHCLKRFTQRSVLVGISPEGLTIGMDPRVTGKGKPTFKQLFNHVLSAGEIQ